VDAMKTNNVNVRISDKPAAILSNINCRTMDPKTSITQALTHLDIATLLHSSDEESRRQLLEILQPIELADMLVQLPLQEQEIFFNELSTGQAVQTFEFLPFPVQRELIHVLHPEQTAHLLKEMSPDDRTAFLEELPQAAVNELLKLLPLEERILALTLLGYPKDSVGRLMTTDYIAVTNEWTVQQILDYVREHGQDSETINVIYIIDEHGHLIDDIRIKELLFAPVNTQLKDLTDNRFISLSVSDTDEEAIQVFSRYNRAALPVTDGQGQLIGIVTIDDILNLVNEENTREIQQIGGSEALDAPYMQTPFLSLMKKRGSWLIILFIGEMFTTTAMGFFEEEISKAVILAIFLPLIISSGGNSGSQASTLIIRALSIGEVTIKDWWKIMKRELFSGLFLGSLLGLIGFFRISIWSFFTPIYGPHWILVGWTIFFSLMGVVLWGTLMGAMAPLILRRIGFDPAVASAPLVATLVDVTGILIYFFTSIIILKGTLLA
jgi:magnesium transporter